MDLQAIAIRLSSLEQSEQSEQVRIFLLFSIRLQFKAFPHCLSSGCEEYFWNDLKTVRSTSANISWVVKLHIQWISLWGLGPSFIFRPNCGPKGRKGKVGRPGPPLISGSGLPSPPPPNLSEGLDLPLKDLNGPEKRNLLHKRKNKQGTRDTLCLFQSQASFFNPLEFSTKMFSCLHLKMSTQNLL